MVVSRELLSESLLPDAHALARVDEHAPEGDLRRRLERGARAALLTS
jgi:hypothetical protein